MKFFIAIDGLVGNSLGHVLTTFFDSTTCCQVDIASEADLIIVQERQQLNELYSVEKKFAVISMEEIQSLPENVRWFHITTVVAELISYISEINKGVTIKKIDERVVTGEAIKTGVAYIPVPRNKNDVLHVLIVDDSQENLKLALELLGKKHFVTLAAGYGEGRRLIEKNFYDAVLSDCRMPVDIKNSAIHPNAVNLGETVHNGPFLMFPATKEGSRFAIVTDANHHQDWVSAIFDDLRDLQTINGQPVLFINYMGKRWDEALEKLMSL